MTDVTALLAKLSPEQHVHLEWQRRWLETARPNQIVPTSDWTECGYLAGRGFGKTRVGAEWITRATYEDPSGFPACVIAPTYQDVKFTCFEGESGILNVVPPELVIEYNKSDLFIRMRNIAGGEATIRGFTAEKPERLRGPQHARIWCFVAGTMIATPEGGRPIEALRAGDVVLTRKGPRRVVSNASRDADVGRVEFSTGAVLLGTADHPVYTLAGWTDFSRLQVGDEVCAIAAWSGAASGGTGTEAVTTSARTSLSGPSAPSDCTERSGRRSRGRSLTAGKYTTATRMSATTALLISSVSRLVSTAAYIWRPSLFLDRIGVINPWSAASAPTAVQQSSASGPAHSQSARAASTDAPSSGASTKRPAPTAARSSAPAPETFAASVASTWQPMGRRSVFCLKVEGEPEYFANGILVHNCDELAAWAYDEDTWDMAMMGLRLGKDPQVLWTTTPKPKELIRKLSAPQDRRIIVRGSTFDNKANLPDAFFKQLEQYEGTTIGRQELYGELIDPEESGIVKRSDFRLWPAKKPLPPFDFIILSLDTAFTEATFDKKKGDPDSTACIVMGSFSDREGHKHLMVLDCWSEQMGMPDLIKRVKRELNVAYGDDQDTALIKPMFGSAKPLTSGRKPDLCLIEDKGSGISLRQMLEREGIVAYAYNPGRADKLTRLHMVSHIFARKRVWLPESDKFPGRPRTWVEPMLAQVCAFTGPGSIKHDDYVDSLTQCVRLCVDKGLVSVLRDKKPAAGDRPPPKIVTNPYSQ